MTNIDKAQSIVFNLYSKGMREFVICPGGRNAPFIEVLDKLEDQDIQVHYGFEERSAAFFALGRTKKKYSQKLKPQEQSSYVGIFTTSGTAFVETASALLEAHYSGLPLVVVSADRPQKLWGTGAPQTMRQKDLLAYNVGPTLSPEELGLILHDKVFHINCEFDEPLIDKACTSWSFSRFKESLQKPEKNFIKKSISSDPSQGFACYKGSQIQKDLARCQSPKIFFLVTGLNEYEKYKIKEDLSLVNEEDIFFESSGEIEGLRGLESSYKISYKILKSDYDYLVRVGGIPVHKLWRDVENQKYKNVVNFSSKNFVGLSFSEVCPLEEFRDFISDIKSKDENKSQKNKAQEDEIQSDKDPVFNFFRSSSEDLNRESHFIFEMKKKFTPESVEFYLGNSSPIRHWDVLKYCDSYRVHANRGLNGIDGQLSTALGLAYKSQKKIIAILGDLTTLYDLSAPWFWIKNKNYFNICLVIVNNYGGQIFSNMYESKAFINSHKVEFAHWAKFWGLSYFKCEDVEGMKKLSNDSLPDIIEYCPLS